MVKHLNTKSLHNRWSNIIVFLVSSRIFYSAPTGGVCQIRRCGWTLQSRFSSQILLLEEKNTQSPNFSLILLSNKFKGHKLINSKASLPSTFIPAPTGKLVGLSKEDIYGLPCLWLNISSEFPHQVIFSLGPACGCVITLSSYNRSLKHLSLLGIGGKLSDSVYAF